MSADSDSSLLPSPLAEVLADIQQAEQRAGRVGQVQLVAVTKGHTPQEVVRHVLSQPGGAGLPLAESRGQELRDKQRELAELGQQVAEWHFIGPLQRNKIKYLSRVTLVHTLEAAWQAEEIARAAHKWGQAPDVLLQMHNGEAQKHGCAPQDLPRLYHEVMQTGLQVRGLMVMAPYGQPEAAQRLFSDAAQRAHDLGLSDLSMGMSDDFPQAIAAGATLVRVGTRLFTDPPVTDPATTAPPTRTP